MNVMGIVGVMLVICYMLSEIDAGVAFVSTVSQLQVDVEVDHDGVDTPNSTSFFTILLSFHCPSVVTPHPCSPHI